MCLSKRVLCLSMGIVISFVFSAACAEEKEKQPATKKNGRDLASWFRGQDKNNDGRLEKSEVTEQVWQRLQRVDANGDGSVTLAEMADNETRGTRPGGVGTAYAVKTFRGEDGTEIRYGWLTPTKIKEGEKYPLVLCLHGRGGNTHAADVLARSAMMEKCPCFVVAPETGEKASWAYTEVLGRGKQNEKLPLAVATIRSLMKTEPIDPARIYVTGQSMGGVGTWGALAKYPDFFAAGVPVCGAWDVNHVKTISQTPVWAFHGEKDATVPPKTAREITAAIPKLGGVAKYTEYPGVGHGSWNQAYDEASMWDWMFQQKRSSATK